jgi:hypothetical protein
MPYIVREGKKINNMKKSVIATPYSHYVVITTIIVYALLCPIFFEMDNALGEEEKFVVVDDTDDKSMVTYSQQQVDAKCTSPCSSSAEICIAMCA